MSTKYFKYSVKAEQMNDALTEAGAHGLIVRTHVEGGQAHVFVAAEGPAENAKFKPTEVSEKDIIKVG
jgi:hypothetical protein